MKKKPVVRKVEKVEASIKGNARVVVRHVPRRKFKNKAATPHLELAVEKLKRADQEGASGIPQKLTEQEPPLAVLPHKVTLASTRARALQETHQYPVNQQYPVNPYPVTAEYWTTTAIAMVQTTPAAVASIASMPAPAVPWSRTNTLEPVLPDDSDDDVLTMSVILVVILLIAMYWFFSQSFRASGQPDFSNANTRRRTFTTQGTGDLRRQSQSGNGSQTPGGNSGASDLPGAMNRQTLRTVTKGPADSSSSEDERPHKYPSPRTSGQTDIRRTLGDAIGQSEPVGRPKFTRQVVKSFGARPLEEQTEEPGRGRGRGSISGVSSVSATPPGAAPLKLPDDRDLLPSVSPRPERPARAVRSTSKLGDLLVDTRSASKHGDRDLSPPASPRNATSSRNVRRMRSAHRMESKLILDPAG